MDSRYDGVPIPPTPTRYRTELLTLGSPQLPTVATAWGEWLGGYPWEAWGTLTFRWSAPSPAALARAFEGFREFCAPPPSKGHLSYFLAHEVGAGGRSHVHTLLAGLWPYTPRSSAYDWWARRYGRCEVRGYDPERGAAHYVAKYVGKSLADYDLDLGGFSCRSTAGHPARSTPRWMRRRDGMA